MNTQRASEIMRSKGVINVSYNGMPVWLENIREDNMEVTFIDTKEKTSVPISSLVEADPLHSI